MEEDVYRSCIDEKDTIKRLKNHIKGKKVCKHLKLIMTEVILTDNDDKIMGLDTIKNIVKDVKF